jgi:hypothetical protein
MFCNYCRAVNPTDAVYCSACGRKIQIALEGCSGGQEAQPENADLPIRSVPSRGVKNNNENQLLEVSTASCVGSNPSSISSPNRKHSAPGTDRVPDTKAILATLTSERSAIERSMTCPQCDLINPCTAQRCDCGYDFETKTVEKPYSTAKKENRFVSFKALGMLGIFLTAAIVTSWLASELFRIPSEAVALLTKISLNLALAAFFLARAFGGAWLTTRRTIALAAGLSVCLFLGAIYLVTTAGK